jgi:hypothetical protein
MKRLRHWLFNFAAAVSIALCLAMVLSWVRSESKSDLVRYRSAGGAAPTHVCDSSPRENGGAKSQLTGEAGCGNSEGCGTCLSAATYPLNVPGEPSPMKPESSVESPSDA